MCDKGCVNAELRTSHPPRSLDFWGFARDNGFVTRTIMLVFCGFACAGCTYSAAVLQNCDPHPPPKHLAACYSV